MKDDSEITLELSAGGGSVLVCPFCNFRARSPNALGSHFQTTHPELLGILPPDLSKRLKGKQTLASMLKEVGNWIEAGPSVVLSAEVLQRLETADAKIHVGLRAIAVDKLRRAMELGRKQRYIDYELRRRTTRQKLKELDNKSLLEMMHAMQSEIQNDLRFVRDVLSLSAPAVGDAFARILDLIAQAHTAALNTDTKVITLTDGDVKVHLPESPQGREALRLEVMRQLEEGSGIEAEDED